MMHSRTETVAWDTAHLDLDNTGKIIALRPNRPVGPPAQNYLVTPWRPFCSICTTKTILDPFAVDKTIINDGFQFSFRFEGGGLLTYSVTLHARMSLWQVTEWIAPELGNDDAIRSVQLCNLDAGVLGTQSGILNACYDDNFAIGLMATSRVVRAAPGGKNSAHVFHRFFRVNSGPVASAHFSASCGSLCEPGWSQRIRNFDEPIDLSGVKTDGEIHARLRGNLKKDVILNVQLADRVPGCDKAVTLDFGAKPSLTEDWQDISFNLAQGQDQKPFNSSRVASLRFYYNGLAANQRVWCEIADVRPVLTRGNDELKVLFHPASEVWDARLTARVYAQEKVEGTGVAIIACPSDAFRSAIFDFEKATGLAAPLLENRWCKDSPKSRRSYLFVNGKYEYRDADTIVRWAKRGSFPQVLLGHWSKSHYHHLIDRQRFPGGLASEAITRFWGRIVDRLRFSLLKCKQDKTLMGFVRRLRCAGVDVGLHIRVAAVDTGDPHFLKDEQLARPLRAQRGLGTDAEVSLAGDVEVDTSNTCFTLRTEQSPADFPDPRKVHQQEGPSLNLLLIRAQDGFYYLCAYDGLSTAEGFFAFEECRLLSSLDYCRNPKTASPIQAPIRVTFEKGTTISRPKCKDSWFFFDIDEPPDVIDIDKFWHSERRTAIQHTCHIVNRLGIDFLYLDGADSFPGGARSEWYYNAWVLDDYYQNLDNKDMLLQASQLSHYSWHLASRQASGDIVFQGEGDIKGAVDKALVRAVPTITKNFLQPQLGWVKIKKPEITIDEIEYLMQKALAYPCSVGVNTDLNWLETHPEADWIFSLFSRYENLRIRSSLSPAKREGLLQPGREYRLLPKSRLLPFLKDRLRRISYEAWQDISETQQEFSVFSKHDPCIAQLGVHIWGNGGSSEELRRPRVRVGSREVCFNVTLKGGQRLLWYSGERPLLFTERKQSPEVVGRLLRGPVIGLKDKFNTVYFSSEKLSGAFKIRFIHAYPCEEITL